MTRKDLEQRAREWVGRMDLKGRSRTHGADYLMHQKTLRLLEAALAVVDAAKDQLDPNLDLQNALAAFQQAAGDKDGTEACIGRELPAGWIEKHGLKDSSGDSDEG